MQILELMKLAKSCLSHHIELNVTYEKRAARVIVRLLPKSHDYRQWQAEIWIDEAETDFDAMFNKELEIAIGTMLRTKGIQFADQVK